MMENDNVNQLAAKIAKILESESAVANPSLQISIEKINSRLNVIESKLSGNPLSANGILHTSHPSQEKFDVIEAIADQIIDQNQKEKTCTFEPNGKPCDHCSMCSSRGF